MKYNREQIMNFSPDEASTKAGIQLANKSKWLLLASDESALWGECQGSGKNPYITFIDISNVAFKCTCPSRKFPCKHGLGLFFLFSENEEYFEKGKEQPDALKEWLNKRTTKADKSTEVKTEKSIDIQAQQKRQEARALKVNRGIEELQTWIKDKIRSGLMSLPYEYYDFTKNIIARMNDAQSSGLAFQLEKLQLINYKSENWSVDVLKQLTRIYMITRAYLHREQFSQELKFEIENLIGWNLSKDTVLSSTPVNDNWIVLSKKINKEEYLISEQIWLFGTETKRFALILNYYTTQQIPEQSLVPGTHFKGSLVYYPFQYKMRALLNEISEVRTDFPLVGGVKLIHSLKDYYMMNLQVQPLINGVPAFISDFTIVSQHEKWWLSDDEGYSLPITNIETVIYFILSITGGEKLNAFIWLENNEITINGFWFNRKYYYL